jgi:hypothetical protein
VLTGAALSRLAITPDTPIATFVKRLRCSRCGGRSVLATRKPPARPQRRRKCAALHASQRMPSAAKADLAIHHQECSHQIQASIPFNLTESGD